MNNKNLLKKLLDLRACEAAVKWTNGKDLETAWKKCERADWLIWFIFRMEIGTKRERIHIVCDCVANALKYIPKGEDRPRLAIEATRNYADNPTNKNRKAWNRAASMAEVAAGAAWAAAAAVAAAAVGEARKASHQQMCNMIRKKIKLPKKLLK